MDTQAQKEKLDQIGKILLGPGGFFESMPEDQKDMFGEAIMIMAKLAAHEMIQEQIGGGFEINLNLASINLDKLFNISPKPFYREEPYRDGGQMPPSGCGNCGQNPCMCDNQYKPSYGCPSCGSDPCMCNMSYNQVGCPKCNMEPCMCTAPWEEPSMEMPPMPDENQTKLTLEEMNVDTSDMMYDPAMEATMPTSDDTMYTDPAMDMIQDPLPSHPPMSGDTV